MRVENITVRGFRGFNQQRNIEFDRKLTLIYARNSYGKTSISESLEWLLYGITSKVEQAEYSKLEYKGAYRNCHFAASEMPFVEALLGTDTGILTIRRELADNDATVKYVDGEEVQAWPFEEEVAECSKPFILQHALKMLLLVAPSDRYKKIAELLGLNALSQIQDDLTKLCTKPDAAIPPGVAQFQKQIEALLNRTGNQPTLAPIFELVSKFELDEAFGALAGVSRDRLNSTDVDQKAIYPQLLKLKEETIAKVFDGRVTLNRFSDVEQKQNQEDEASCTACLSEEFGLQYLGLVTQDSIDYIQRRAQFFDTGIELLEQDNARCPFCGQPVTEDACSYMQAQHTTSTNQREEIRHQQEHRDQLREQLSDLQKRVDKHYERHTQSVAQFLRIKGVLDRVAEFLSGKDILHYQVIERAIGEIGPLCSQLDTTYQCFTKAHQAMSQSIESHSADSVTLKSYLDTLTRYLEATAVLRNAVEQFCSPLSDAEQVLRRELERIAGVEDIAILTELYEGWNNVCKYCNIQKALVGLNELRRIVDQFVSNKILQAISGDFTNEVMKWYKIVRTKGDPEVHFAGFDMERTQQGTLKAKKIQVKAESYGQEMISAVSSLSESKLNALGLCVSIATNLSKDAPFDLLVIDDPIQSWDEEHEIQFIEVIRKLIEHGKQVILLTHNKPWANRVRDLLKPINGIYYEITGYTKEGPHISCLPWCAWKQRLDIVNSIAQDPAADSIRLQEGEAEVRITIEELTVELYQKRLGLSKTAKGLNADEVRKILMKCSVDRNLVERICNTYQDTDPSHHADPGYSPSCQRLRQYHSALCDLTKYL